MNIQKNTLTAHELEALEKNMNNPHACVSDAIFYAHCTGQYDTADVLINIGDKINMLFISLNDENLCPDFDTGTCGLDMLKFATENQANDPRFAEIVELSKARFMVELRESIAENLVEHVKENLLEKDSSLRVLN